MFVVGHIGITLGAARVAAWGFDAARNRFVRSERIEGREGARAGGLRESLDDRALALGSLLPDMLDKPLGLILAADLVGNGTRSVGHTLVFALALLAAAGAATVAFRRAFPMALALAAAGHLALDSMWNHARILLWPLYGWRFPLREETTVTEWTASTLSVFMGRMADPLELAGLAAICWIAARVLWTRSVKTYLLTGRIGAGRRQTRGGGGGEFYKVASAKPIGG